MPISMATWLSPCHEPHEPDEPDEPVVSRASQEMVYTETAAINAQLTPRLSQASVRRNVGDWKPWGHRWYLPYKSLGFSYQVQHLEQFIVLNQRTHCLWMMTFNRSRVQKIRKGLVQVMFDLNELRCMSKMVWNDPVHTHLLYIYMCVYIYVPIYVSIYLSLPSCLHICI